MPSPLAVLRSSVGKKLVSGLTGLLLCGFVAGHLTGNLLLLVGPEAFNEYAHFLETLGHGYALYVAEAGLLAFFLFHVWSGIRVRLDKRKARGSKYRKKGDAGGRSRKSLASQSMLVTGFVLLIFVPVHIWMFKLGPGLDEGYATMVDGEPFRDLYGLVVDHFQNPVVVVGYVAVMALLGLHLWHGFWSAFQSLGANNPKYAPLIRAAGMAFAVLIAVGFLILPIYLYLFVDPSAAGHAAASVGGHS